jgi:hypothetical protein
MALRPTKFFLSISINTLLTFLRGRDLVPYCDEAAIILDRAGIGITA